MRLQLWVLLLHGVLTGFNYRLPQPLNGRMLRVWRQLGDKKSSYLPEDAASAASAGRPPGGGFGCVLITSVGCEPFWRIPLYWACRTCLTDLLFPYMLGFHWGLLPTSRQWYQPECWAVFSRVTDLAGLPPCLSQCGLL